VDQWPAATAEIKTHYRRPFRASELATREIFVRIDFARNPVLDEAVRVAVAADEVECSVPNARERRVVGMISWRRPLTAASATVIIAHGLQKGLHLRVVRLREMQDGAAVQQRLPDHEPSKLPPLKLQQAQNQFQHGFFRRLITSPTLSTFRRGRISQC
jgi:hypothetical protein